MGIKLVQSKLDRAFADGEVHEVWLVLKHRASASDVVLDVVEETDEWTQKLPADSEVGMSQMATWMDGGTAILFSTAGPEGSMRWIFKFITALEERGINGTLTTLTGAKPPDLVGPVSGVSWPTATLFWTHDPATAVLKAKPEFASDSRNLKPRASAYSLLPLTEWALGHPEGVGSIYIHAELGWSQVPVDAPAATIASDVEYRIRQGSPLVVLLIADSDGHTGNGITWVRSNNQTDVQILAPAPLPLWTPETIERLRQVLVRNANYLDTGFVQSGPLERQHTLPGGLGTSSASDYGNHLLDRYVLDACAIQVLTSQHLERVGRLDRWNVTDLGHDRYLVEAPDLDPWFRDEDEPDWDTREQARQDFAELILTTDIVNNNHPAWHVPPLLPTAPTDRDFRWTSFRRHLP